MVEKLLDKNSRVGKFARRMVQVGAFATFMAGASAITPRVAAQEDDRLPSVAVYPSTEDPNVTIIDALLKPGRGLLVGGQPFTNGTIDYGNKLGGKCLPYADVYFADEPHRVQVPVTGVVHVERFYANVDYADLRDKVIPDQLQRAVNQINSEQYADTRSKFPAVQIAGKIVTQRDGNPVIDAVVRPQWVGPDMDRTNEPENACEAAAEAVPTGQAGPEGVGNCFPPARTTFALEGDANVDGTDYHADVRDLVTCVRSFGTWELGIDNPLTPQVEGAHNFKVRIPRGWSMVISPTTVAVHREGGRQVDFIDGQVVIVDGPFNGGVGMYEGWAGLTVTDWAQAIADQRLVIQRQQAIGRSNVNVVRFQG